MTYKVLRRADLQLSCWTCVGAPHTWGGGPLPPARGSRTDLCLPDASPTTAPQPSSVITNATDLESELLAPICVLTKVGALSVFPHCLAQLMVAYIVC